MAVDMFLKIEKMEGESTDADHGGEIDVLAWEWGATQSGTGHMGGGAGAGKVQVQDLKVTKFVDRASPLLFFFCCSGGHVAKALLTVRKSGGDSKVEYLKIEMEQVFIAGVETGGDQDGDRIKETVKLNFAKCKVEYTPQDAKGKAKPSITKGWDIAANKEAS